MAASRTAPPPAAASRADAGTPAETSPLRRRDVWIVLGALAALVLVNVPELGSDPWPFRPGPIEPNGALAFVVDAVGGEWEEEALRAVALLAGLVVTGFAAAAAFVKTWRPGLVIAVTAVVLVLLVLPAVVLQAALRESTAPWFFTNDSTYQMELAGDLVRSGENPYGHDYGGSGLERFYSLDGSTRPVIKEERPALDHFLYFPGPAITAAAWTALPRPWDDYRFLVALATLASFAVVLAFRGPLVWRVVLGAVVAANPLAVRAAWFGTADTTSIVFLLLGFALVTRARYTAAAAALAAAVVMKQFALLALPFFVVMVVTRTTRREALKAAGAFAAVVAAAFVPFIVWDPGAFWSDAVPVGEEAYRIVGAGLASVLVKAGVIDDRTSYYPFLPLVLVVWLPLTALLVWLQVRARTLWFGALGFSASMFVFLYLLRVLQPSYLVWPLVGIAIAALLAAWEERGEVADAPA